MSINELNRWDWLAFCYLSDELSPADRAAFEESLAVDQVAREALARAVEMSCVVAIAESRGPVECAKVSVTPQSSWSRRASWMAVGAAASLLLMVAMSNLGVLRSLTNQPTLAATSGDQQLASAWIATRSEFPIQAAGAWVGDDSLPLADEVYESQDAVEELLAEETPSWMTAALLAQAGVGSEDLLPTRLEN